MLAKDIDELLERVANGAVPRYLFFWGHTPDKSGRVTKSCLSNWYASPFTLDGVVYPTAEHYMMAGKAGLFEDDRAHQAILIAKSPAEAKALGRTVRGFDEATWVSQRKEIVVTGNVARFSQHPELRRFLLATHEAVLVEASPRDRIWGIGMGANDSRVEDPFAWNGLNLLGFALMEVRERLR
jgi:ribA/ribD-fused uncharacterized protein